MSILGYIAIACFALLGLALIERGLKAGRAAEKKEREEKANEVLRETQEKTDKLFRDRIAARKPLPAKAPPPPPPPMRTSGGRTWPTPARRPASPQPSSTSSTDDGINFTNIAVAALVLDALTPDTPAEPTKCEPTFEPGGGSFGGGGASSSWDIPTSSPSSDYSSSSRDTDYSSSSSSNDSSSSSYDSSSSSNDY